MILLEYSVTKHQKFEFSTLYIQKYVQNHREISNRLFVCFVHFVYFSVTSKLIFCFASISSKSSHLFIAIRKITSKRVKIATFNCSFTFFRIFVSKYQKFHFTIDDLIRMFYEKFKSIDLSQHQKRRFFFAKRRRSIICHVSVSHHRLFSVCNQSENIDYDMN